MVKGCSVGFGYLCFFTQFITVKYVKQVTPLTDFRYQRLRVTGGVLYGVEVDLNQPRSLILTLTSEGRSKFEHSEGLSFVRDREPVSYPSVN